MRPATRRLSTRDKASIELTRDLESSKVLPWLKIEEEKICSLAVFISIRKGRKTWSSAWPKDSIVSSECICIHSELIQMQRDRVCDPRLAERTTSTGWRTDFCEFKRKRTRTISLRDAPFLATIDELKNQSSRECRGWKKRFVRGRWILHLRFEWKYMCKESCREVDLEFQRRRKKFLFSLHCVSTRREESDSSLEKWRESFLINCVLTATLWFWTRGVCLYFEQCLTVCFVIWLFRLGLMLQPMID